MLRLSVRLLRLVTNPTLCMYCVLFMFALFNYVCTVASLYLLPFVVNKRWWIYFLNFGLKTLDRHRAEYPERGDLRLPSWSFVQYTALYCFMRRHSVHYWLFGLFFCRNETRFATIWIMALQVDDYGCHGVVFHCYDNALQPSNRLHAGNNVERRKGAVGAVKRLAALPRDLPSVGGKPASSLCHGPIRRKMMENLVYLRM